MDAPRDIEGIMATVDFVLLRKTPTFEGSLEMATPVTCDLAKGAVEVKGDSLTQCNGGGPSNLTGDLTISGGNGNHGIVITGTELEITLSGVNSTPLLIQESSVRIFLTGGPSEFKSTEPTLPPFECSGDSNVTVNASGNSLEVTAQGGAAAIGAGPGGSCRSLWIAGATVNAYAGTGIGASPVSGGQSSYLGELKITGATITVDASSGSGIGTGTSGANGLSRIDNITIEKSKLDSLAANRGPAVGAGQASDFGNSSIGNILISGTSFTTISVQGSSGIGCGTANTSGTSRIDNLTIWNTNIGWSGDAEGAGIGAGIADDGAVSSIGVLFISSSSVKGHSSGVGSGIGAGMGKNGAISAVDNLSIYNSSVYAQSTSSGPGLGAGYAESFGLSQVGVIWVSHSSVTAESKAWGAGIGTGSVNSDGHSRVGLIHLYMAWVDAKSIDPGNGPGLGSAIAGDGRSEVNTILIQQTTVKAASSSYGSGIGSGKVWGNGISSVDSITISGSSTIFASCSSSGSGIGSGVADSDQSTSSVGTISINGGTVTATSVGGKGSGIGAGPPSSGTSHVGNITIAGANISAISDPDSSVIGSRPSGDGVDLLTFSGSCFIECNGTRTIPRVTASSIVFSAETKLRFVTDNTPLFGPSPSNDGNFDLVIGYHEVTVEGSENLSLLPPPFLHIGNWNFTDSEITNLCTVRTGFDRCFNESENAIKSIILMYARRSATPQFSVSYPLNITVLQPPAETGGVGLSAPLDRSDDLLDSVGLRSAGVLVSDGVTGTESSHGSEGNRKTSRIVPSSFAVPSSILPSLAFLSKEIGDSIAAYGAARSESLTTSVRLTGSGDPLSVGLGSSVQIDASAGSATSFLKFTGILVQSGGTEPSCLISGSVLAISTDLGSSGQIDASADFVHSVVKSSGVLVPSEQSEPSAYSPQSEYSISADLGSSGQIDTSADFVHSVVKSSGVLVPSEQSELSAYSPQSEYSISAELGPSGQISGSSSFSGSVVKFSGTLVTSDRSEPSAFGLGSEGLQVSNGFDGSELQGRTDIPGPSKPEQDSSLSGATDASAVSILFSFSPTFEPLASYRPFIGGADGAQMGATSGGDAAVGASVGIVLGVLAALAIVVFLFLRRRHQEEVEQPGTTDGDSHDSFTGDDEAYLSEENTLHEDDRMQDDLSDILSE
jgi:hypothetical protein